MKRFRSASSVWLNTFVYNHPFLHRGAGLKWAMHECNYGDVICVLGHLVCSHVTFWFVLCIVCFHPANRLIFRSFFMSQCKLIHVDSVQKRRRVDFWDSVCVCVCACLSASRASSCHQRCVALVWDLMQVSALVHCCMKKSISVPSCPQSVLAVMTLQHWEVRWEVCRQKSVFGSLFFPSWSCSKMPEDNTEWCYWAEEQREETPSPPWRGYFLSCEC